MILQRRSPEIGRGRGSRSSHFGSCVCFVRLRRILRSVTSNAPPTEGEVLQARIALVLIVGLLTIGTLWYGLSFENLKRIWTDLLARPGGPMTFRFILQPAMAAFAAFRDGVKDARTGRPPYAWAVVNLAKGRYERLWEGVVSTSRILILGVVVDAIYQWMELKTFYPGQAAIVAILLAFVPYLILRGLVARSARLRYPPSVSS
jgi:hypothetical protein